MQPPAYHIDNIQRREDAKAARRRAKLRKEQQRQRLITEHFIAPARMVDGKAFQL